MRSELLTFAWLALGAFTLGSLPFSVWLGRLFLHKDIRSFGDHNPGAANVFRAGNPVLGMASVFLDIGKGVPFIFLARDQGLSSAATVTIGICAILGHAFSPFLRFHGGKGVAVTYGVLIGLWNPNWLFPFCATAIFGLVILEDNPWIMLLAPAETIAFFVLTRAGVLPIVFMLFVQVLFIYKYWSDVDGPPRLRAFFRERFLPKRQA
jgi:acyl phosphate:glycerol-3-phosphate acyltransferase